MDAPTVAQFRHYTTSREVASTISNEVIAIWNLANLSSYYGSVIDSDSNRNEYRKPSWR
jgi:hypothetical protein